jgi:cytochrome c2
VPHLCRQGLALLLPTLIVAVLLLTACGGQEAAAESEYANPQLAEGQQLFRRYCSSCHATSPGETVVGPSLHGVGARAATRVEGLSAEEYIRTSIVRPDAYTVEGFANLMPDQFGRILGEEQINSLIAFLMSLE